MLQTTLLKVSLKVGRLGRLSGTRRKSQIPPHIRQCFRIFQVHEARPNKLSSGYNNCTVRLPILEAEFKVANALYAV